MNRGLIYFFRVVALIGFGLSFSGLCALVVFRVIPQLADKPEDLIFRILDVFKETGAFFLLSAILFVLCDTALYITAEPHPDSDSQS